MRNEACSIRVWLLMRHTEPERLEGARHFCAADDRNCKGSLSTNMAMAYSPTPRILTVESLNGYESHREDAPKWRAPRPRFGRGQYRADPRQHYPGGRTFFPNGQCACDPAKGTYKCVSLCRGWVVCDFHLLVAFGHSHAHVDSVAIGVRSQLFLHRLRAGRSHSV